MKRFLSTILGLTLLAQTAVAQTPRVLDGDKVSRTSSTRNYIRNPDAMLGVTGAASSGVTVSNATATRSVTTPLGETGTEHNVTITSANGTVDFLSSGATTAMIGSASCEISARVRGFQATSKLQAFDGTNVLATVDIGVQATAREVVLNFPCPSDPSTVRARLTDTATLAGTNEVAGVYFGKARNIGTVASPELVGSIEWAPTAGCIWLRNVGSSAAFPSDAECDDNPRTIIGDVTDVSAGQRPEIRLNSYKPGNYTVVLTGEMGVAASGATTSQSAFFSIFDGAIRSQQQFRQDISSATGIQYVGSTTFAWQNTSSPGATSLITYAGCTGTNCNAAIAVANVPFKISVYRYPLASESAVTPANQNVWGKAVWTGTSDQGTTLTNRIFCNTALTAIASYFGNASAAPNPLAASCTSGASNPGLGATFSNLRGGQWYRATARVFGYCETGAVSGESAECAWRLIDNAGGLGPDVYEFARAPSAVITTEAAPNIITWDFFQTSAGNRNIYISGSKNTGTGGVFTSIRTQYPAEITVEPIDGGMATPVFIQSPVKAAGTGVAPIAGEVGERIVAVRSSIYSQASPAVSTYYDVTSLSITTTTTGTWDLYAQCPLQLDYSSGTGVNIPTIAIRDGSNNVITSAGVALVGSSSINVPVTSSATTSTKTRVSGVAAGTIYKVSMRHVSISGTASFSSIIAYGNLFGANDCFIEAIRVGDR